MADDQHDFDSEFSAGLGDDNMALSDINLLTMSDEQLEVHNNAIPRTPQGILSSFVDGELVFGSNPEERLLLDSDEYTIHFGRARGFDTQVPSLDSAGSTVDDLSTDMSDLSAMVSRQDGHGLPVDGHILQCPYAFLGCNEEFDLIEDFNNHCRAHFPPQRRQTCPFLACGWSEVAGNSHDAWENRVRHIAYYHPQGGAVNVIERPDEDLINHILRRGNIDEATARMLRGYLPNGIFLQTMDPRREQRDRERWQGGPARRRYGR